MSGLKKNSIIMINDYNGFTLVELIVVIAVVGVLSYFAVASFTDSHGKLQYESLAQKVAADVRYARDLALSEGKGTRVFIDQGNNRYYLQWNDGTYIEKPIGGGNFIIQLGTGEFKGIQITGTGFSGGRLDFDTSGSPRNAGADFTGSLNLITLNNKKKIVVTANTGFLKIADL